jgi:hypothetical protein
VGAPDHGKVLSVLDADGPQIGAERLDRVAPTLEQCFDGLPEPTCAFEVAYQGSLRLEEAVLEDPSKLDPQIAGLARWVASALVRLADLQLEFRPPEEDSPSS